MKGQFTYNKNEKLKSRKLIKKLFSEGKSLSQYPLRLLYLYGGNEKHKLQAGVAVSSRNFKKAVDRNRIKRLIREAWRLQKKSLENELDNRASSLSIFIIYTGNELPQFSDISCQVEGIIKKLNNIINENDPLHT